MGTALMMGLALAGCSPSGPDPISTPITQSTRTPPPPVILPTPSFDNWLDAPQTPGDWSYSRSGSETMASFGTPGSSPVFIIRCNPGSGQIGLARAGNAPGAIPMQIRTETMDKTISIGPVGGSQGILANTVSSQDRLLDAMAFSRGRFAVNVAGLPALYLPAWPEISRVIEDCR